jgi:hypothetical protein
MQRTLSEHIAYLEQKIDALKKQLQESETTPSQQSEIRIDLGIAERSLVHFQKAFDFETKLKQRLSR